MAMLEQNAMALGMAKEAAPRESIGEAMDALDKAIAFLQDEIDVMVSKVSPIMVPSEPIAEVRSAEPHQGSDLKIAILQRADRVSDTAISLRAARNRIDL